MNPQNQMDPQAIALAQAIRQTESNNNFNQTGKSGEIGAYQWMPDTWKSHAQQVLGDANAPLTPSNQNAVAYTVIKQWKDQGLNPAQIAAKWNSGSESNWENKVGTNAKGVAYDVPAYVKKVTESYQQFKPNSAANPLGANVASASTGADTGASSSGPAFPYNSSDNGLTAGLKAVGNLPGSFGGFVKNTAQSFNPATALSNLDQIGSGFSELAHEEGYAKAFMDVLKGIPKAAYDTLVPAGVRDIVSGDIGGAAKQFTNDPFGQTAPVVLAAVGGASALDRVTGKTVPTNAVPGQTMYVDPNGTVSGAPRGAASAAVDSAISKMGGGVVDAASAAAGKVAGPLGTAAGSVAGFAGTLSRSLASHLTALNPETISQVISDPEMFSKVAQDQVNRANIFDAVKSGLADLKNAYGENGALYETIKADTATKVTVPEDFLSSILERHGLHLVNGEVIADSNSITRNASDIKAIQKFVDDWNDKTELAPREYLNMRKDANTTMAKYGKDVGSNPDAKTVGKAIYEEMNKTMRPQIKGLKELDNAASPQIKLIEQARKDFLNADGTFKDNAPSKIVNSLNKEGLLSRLEKLRPGITKQLQILKAVEDIERAKGVKIGSYTRSVIEGFAVGGHLAAVAAAIISNPSVAVPLIRGASLTAAQVASLVTILRTVAGDVGSAINNAPNTAPGNLSASAVAGATAHESQNKQ